MKSSRQIPIVMPTPVGYPVYPSYGYPGYPINVGFNPVYHSGYYGHHGYHGHHWNHDHHGHHNGHHHGHRESSF